MIGSTVYVTDDNGIKHAATVVGEEKLFGPFRSYHLVVEDSGQELNLAPQFFSTS